MWLIVRCHFPQDLRKKGVASIFNKGKSGCVRDVQFSPFHYFQYAAAFENGNIQVSYQDGHW